MIAVYLAVYLQTPTATGGDLAPLATLLVQIGLAGVFLWQWQRSENERRAGDQRWQVFAEKALPILDSAAKALDRINTGLASTVEKSASVPSRADFDVAARRNEMVADHLTDVAGKLAQALADLNEARGDTHG